VHKLLIPRVRFEVHDVPAIYFLFKDDELFSSLFFGGGKVQFKKDLQLAFKESAWPYTRALMGSFEPSHQEKEAVCAMLLSELVEI